MAASHSTTSDSAAFGSVSDRSLLRRFRTGEEDAATAIYLRYAARLNKLARSKTNTNMMGRVDPEGIVQSVFRTFFRRAAVGQYDVPDGEELWKLFLVIALNKIRHSTSHHRALKRDIGKTEPIDLRDGITGDDGCRMEAFSALRMTIHDLLDNLSDSHKRIVALRIEGHEVAEIARATERSQRSVERLLQDFRGRLADRIRQD